MNYDTWKLTWKLTPPPYFEYGPEPKDCEGCGNQVEEVLADEGDLCSACLITLEEM